MPPVASNSCNPIIIVAFVLNSERIKAAIKRRFDKAEEDG